MKLHLAPRPRTIDVEGGSRRLAADRTIVLHADAAPQCLPGARMLQEALERDAGVRWEVRAAPGLAEREGVVAVIDPKAVRKREGYHLTIGEERVAIVGHDAAGVFYAFATLTQIVRQCGRRVPLLHIEDAPEFAHRGVMLDVSRDRVPTMATLYGLIDMLAGWKINQFQLYMEHTFAYDAHRAVWRDASPFTGEELLALDSFCRDRHVELVPNQNSFGHMSRWLEKKPYNALAEAPRGTTMPWGKLPPFTLNPADPRSLDLIDGLYAELLPHFTSSNVNVGCDETFDLGRGKSAQAVAERGAGRVYLEFLLKIHRLTEKHGRRMMFWGDIVMQHPELISEIPRDVTALEWGYEHDHPYDRDTRAFRKAGLPFYVCPGAGGWNSLIGRTDNVIANIENATTNGRKRGAAGVLTTEWGDNGHMQPLAAAYLGLLYGAAMSWSPTTGAPANLARALSLHAFDDPSGVTGQAMYDLGNAYTVSGAQTRNGTIPAQMFALPVESDWPVHRARPGGFDETSDFIRDTAARIDPALMRRPDAQIVADEILCAAEMAGVGAAIAATKQMRADGAASSRVSRGFVRAAKRIDRVLPEYERIWLERSRPGGMRDSTARLRTLAASLRKT